MASNKNQHFVPKVYLKPFGNNSGRSINLFAYSSDKCIQNASIKGQCSGSYFYGKEEVFDNFNKHFEGKYGEAVSRIVAGKFSPSEISTLFRFFVLQNLRTPHWLKQRECAFDAFKNTVIGGKPLHELSKQAQMVFDPQREMQQQIYIAAKASNALHDLRPVILVNRTKVPFITSDNPACITNRLYTQRYRDETSGLSQSGLAIALPINAHLTFFAYDDDVYQSIGHSIVHEIRNEIDVHRLNELQAIMATQALYFTNWEDRAYITDLAEKTHDRRRDSWLFVWTGIRDGEAAGFERYRKVTEADAESKATRITSISPYTAAPSTWPSFLRFKLRPRGFTTGSAIGYLRAGHAEKYTEIPSEATILPKQIPRHHLPQFRDVIWEKVSRKEVAA